MAYGSVLAWAVAVLAFATAAAVIVRARVSVDRAASEQASEHSQLVVEEERLRIAREVHDQVAHSLALINAQAAAGAEAVPRHPEDATAAFEGIRATSANALNDLRTTLTVVRAGEDAAAGAGLDQMSELFDHARGTGVEVRVHGTPGPLPDDVDAAAYRILQESITNVVRHATGASRVDVRFEWVDGHLQLTVADDGAGARNVRPGVGLRGMRERMVALGGHFSAGAQPGGGFEVRAVFPAVAH